MTKERVEAQREPELCANCGKEIWQYNLAPWTWTHTETGRAPCASYAMPITRSRPTEAAAIRRQALGEAAQIADAEKRVGLENAADASDPDFDDGYGEAAQLIAVNIRAIAPTPSKPSTADRDLLDEAVAALREIANDDSCGCECNNEDCCVVVQAPCAKCTARAVLAKIDAAERNR